MSKRCNGAEVITWKWQIRNMNGNVVIGVCGKTHHAKDKKVLGANLEGYVKI